MTQKATEEVSEERLVRYADIPVEIRVEMDRRILTMREILDLHEGSLIGTDRSAGENIDIYIGGELVGYGEIVVMENIMGVRITDFRDEE
jgi:flagellar motor switch protein FliN/FliY